MNSAAPSYPSAYPSVNDTAALCGIEVEPSRIEKALADFWKESGGTATRASLINLAVYSESPDALAQNAAILSDLARSHAFRAILVAANPSSPEPSVRSWINAHCLLGKSGGKEVCCEQITFAISGPVEHLIPNLVFSHLDSDLPLYFWWQGEFNERLSPQIVKWADRLIYDSACWTDAKAQLATLRRLATALRSTGMLCDLNWARSLPMRKAIAHLFDHPTPATTRGKARSLRLSHASAHRTLARIFLAWIATRLEWSLEVREISAPGPGSSTLRFRRPDGSLIDVFFQPGNGAPLSEVFIEAGQVTLRLWTDAPTAPIRASICVGDNCSFEELMPSGADDPASLLKSELAVGGRHLTYPHILDTLALIL